jgi:hypothetical protein
LDREDLKEILRDLVVDANDDRVTYIRGETDELKSGSLGDEKPRRILVEVGDARERYKFLLERNRTGGDVDHVERCTWNSYVRSGDPHRDEVPVPVGGEPRSEVTDIPEVRCDEAEVRYIYPVDLILLRRSRTRIDDGSWSDPIERTCDDVQDRDGFAAHSVRVSTLSL